MSRILTVHEDHATPVLRKAFSAAVIVMKSPGVATDLTKVVVEAAADALEGANSAAKAAAIKIYARARE